MKIKDIICNEKFDINCDFIIESCDENMYITSDNNIYFYER